MKGSIGCPTRIVTIIPKQREAAKLGSVELSEKAKRRLEILDWYFLKSASHSANGKPNIKLTCRHFGIYRSQFYRRLNRYDKKRPASLEPSSTTPKNKRRPEYSRELVSEVRKIREENQTYSGKKIRPILLREMDEGDVPSIASIGRLIKRENLFFRPDTKRHRKRSKSAVKGHERKRKPSGLKADKANKVIEYDMKHVYLLGNRLYVFCAIDPFSYITSTEKTKPNAQTVRTTTKYDDGRYVPDTIEYNRPSDLKDTTTVSSEFEGASLSLGAGFTFNFTPGFAVDLAFTTTGFTLDMSQASVLFLIKGAPSTEE